MNRNIKLVRVCNWDRQSGKTTFVINEIKSLKENQDFQFVIISPDENQNFNFHKEFKNDKNILITTSYKLKENILLALAPNKKLINIYLHEITYINISYEELMIKLADYTKFADVTRITFIGTEKLKPTWLERTSAMIKDRKDWENDYHK